jgi:hypothetical protein
MRACTRARMYSSPFMAVVVVEGMDGANSGTDTPTPAPYATYNLGWLRYARNARHAMLYWAASRREPHLT